MEQFKIILKNGTGDIIEKKSRFIASVVSVDTEEAALNFIEQCRKKYWDASHNCFAYVIGKSQQLQRCSDDREPSGTAGKPILDIILNQKLHNTLIVVTRYFGGTLLGTGGLVRAYQKAAMEGIANCTIALKETGSKIYITAAYTELGVIQYIMSEMNIPTLSADYADNVSLCILCEINAVESFIKKITEATKGRIQTDIGDISYFANTSDGLIFFND